MFLNHRTRPRHPWVLVKFTQFHPFKNEGQKDQEIRIAGDIELIYTSNTYHKQHILKIYA